MNGIVRIYPTDRCLFLQSFTDYFSVLSDAYAGIVEVTEENLFEAHFECLGKADQFAKKSRDIISELGYNVAVDVQMINDLPSE